MDALGGYHEVEQSSARLLGAAVFVGMLCLTAILERLQFRLRATEASRWWASNGRDVVNAFALAATWAGLWMIGFTGPIALSIAATLVLILSAIQTSLERHAWAGRLNLAVALALGAPALVAPRAVHRVFRAAVELLFPA